MDLVDTQAMWMILYVNAARLSYGDRELGTTNTDLTLPCQPNFRGRAARRETFASVPT